MSLLRTAPFLRRESTRASPASTDEYSSDIPLDRLPSAWRLAIRELPVDAT